MDLRAYLDILRRRGWIILLVALLAAVMTFGVSRLQTQIYRATARISTVPARPDWGLGNSAKDLQRNFVNNIKTHDMANQVIARAELDMNSYDLLAKVTVSAEPDNFLIRIDANDQDPEIAKRIAKTMADIFVDDRVAYYNTQDKSDRIEVKLVDSVIDAPLYRPRPLVNALAAAVLGALIGALIVLALEWMSADILATPQNVEQVLGLPVSGAIPAQDAAARSPRQSGPRLLASPLPGNVEFPDESTRGTSMASKLIAVSDPASPVAEAYRRLRTNLMGAAAEAPLGTLLVTAAGTGDDNAQIVANLAVTFARIGKQVILADCDLRHPAQHAIFDLPNEQGVSTALMDGRSPLPLYESGVPCLRVLPSGPVTEVPADLVASPAMSQLLARLSEEADIVLLDAPPVVLATDAASLAAQVDGVLLTVSAGQTRREDAQQAKEMLEKVGARLVGAALVNVPMDAQLRKYLKS